MAGIVSCQIAQLYMINKLSKYDFVIQEWEEHTSYSPIQNKYIEDYLKDAIVFYMPKYKGELYKYATLTRDTDKVNCYVLTIYGAPMSKEDIEKGYDKEYNDGGDLSGILTGGKLLSHINNGYPKVERIKIDF